ncbi:MAG: hypothetical protein Q7U76_18060 [Nitrospirota bacterium]|nr:hypothetical protein [Nitrospirota bacterium]
MPKTQASMRVILTAKNFCSPTILAISFHERSLIVGGELNDLALRTVTRHQPLAVTWCEMAQEQECRSSHD